MIKMVEVPVFPSTDRQCAPAPVSASEKPVLYAVFPIHLIHSIVALNSGAEPKYVCCQGRNLGT